MCGQGEFEFLRLLTGQQLSNISCKNNTQFSFEITLALLIDI